LVAFRGSFVKFGGACATSFSRDCVGFESNSVFLGFGGGAWDCARGGGDGEAAFTALRFRFEEFMEVFIASRTPERKSSSIRLVKGEELD
jgi:hypothetical protein